ncbi:MAG: hypothetical protein KI786_02260 [Mameliella sp.]|nr:hypothetical protein [Phaeodactylibacter sp.]NRA51280.1 hypothetical protein [Phaeodactylibacter sp.]
MPVSQEPEHQSDPLQQLRTILLRPEQERITHIHNILEEKEPLAERVVPIIEEQLSEFEEHFPKAYQLAVDRMVEQKIRASQDEIIEVLYPVLGTMIRKYIAQQLQELRANVEEQLEKSFLARLRDRLFKRGGAGEADLILRNAALPRVREAYVIEQHSGLLLGSATTEEVVDKELIAGMLTAIKSFVVDAFRRGATQLELIEYAGYQILIQDFHTYFIALAVEGKMTTKEQQELSDQIATFVQNELTRKVKAEDASLHLHLGKTLRAYFMKTMPQSA